MGLRVGTNIQSLVAQRYLGNNVEAKGASLEKLASGARINKSADDAAGLAIAESLRANVRSVNQNIRNASDGVSMIQTAEGGMNEISNILIRFRELSIQAASDTVGERERGFIDKEVQQLREEMDRIALSTEFNGTSLLSGEGSALEIQVGVNNDPKKDRFVFDPSKTDVRSETLGLNGIAVKTKEQAQQNLEKIDNAIKTLTENRSDLGALQNRFLSSISNMGIYKENLSAARSRIWDVDMAEETANLTKNNVLSQASTAVLSQANQNAALALNLLG